MKKILRNIVIVQLIILVCLIVKPYLASVKVFASHEANTPESFIINITSVILTKETGGEISVFSGNQEVDLASKDSFQSIIKIKGDVPNGKYTKASVSFDSTKFKVKGTVVLNGATYYTKANHTDFTTGPAELEEFSNVHQGGVVTQTFLTPLDVTGQTTISLIVDIANVLAYWDNKDTEPTPGLGGAKTFIVNTPMAVVVGTPGSKEIYNCVKSTDSATGIGRLGLIFDGNNTFVGGMGRALLKNSNTSSIFFTGGFPIDKYTVQSDGNITIEASSLGASREPIWWKLTNFKRTSHTGNWESVYLGTTISGTYTATRIE